MSLYNTMAYIQVELDKIIIYYTQILVATEMKCFERRSHVQYVTTYLTEVGGGSMKPTPDHGADSSRTLLYCTSSSSNHYAVTRPLWMNILLLSFCNIQILYSCREILTGHNMNDHVKLGFNGLYTNSKYIASNFNQL